METPALAIFERPGEFSILILSFSSCLQGRDRPQPGPEVLPVISVAAISVDIQLVLFGLIPVFECVVFSKRDTELLLKLIANLNMLLRDENVNVVKKAILAMTQLYKVALQVS